MIVNDRTHHSVTLVADQFQRDGAYNDAGSDAPGLQQRAPEEPTTAERWNTLERRAPGQTALEG